MTDAALAVAAVKEDSAKTAGTAPAPTDNATSRAINPPRAETLAHATQSISDVLDSVDWWRLARGWLLGALSIAFGIVIWQLASAYKLNFIVRFENIPPPLVVFAAFAKHAQEVKFYLHILVSIKRILIGFVLAAIVGVIVGVAIGRSRIARDIVSPYIELLRPIPAVAWIPLAILMWPTEEASIIFITFLGALFPIVLNTVHGVEQTPEVLVKAAQSLGATPPQIFRHVVVPAALPSIAAGLAIAMGVSWFSLLAGEIISGQYGIGYFTWNAYSLIDYPDIIVGMLVIGLLGTLSTLAVRAITRPLLAWQRKSR